MERRACAVVLVGLVSLGPMAGPFASGQGPDSADGLYAKRDDLPSAQAAAAQWDARLQSNHADFEAAWKRAKAAYWIGSHLPSPDRRHEYERGLEAARAAIQLHADRPEGHFWLAATMGAMAESFGLLTGIKYRAPVRDELEMVLRLDPAFEQGSADRALGRWYFRVPGLFGGSKSRAVEHLRQSLTYDPTNAASHFFLAETFREMGRTDEARRELQQVVEAPLAPGWEPETRDFQRKARALLAERR